MSEPEDEHIANSNIKGQSNAESDTKNKLKSRSRKRKRLDSSSSSDCLPENALEMEKNLHASAIKNNLDDISVKKILKKVVTNDHVLALVKLREEEEESSADEKVRPKLTRAKVKELMKVSPRSAPWNLENLELTPIKHIPIKTRPEVTALIAQDLPDDEDDDEYQPTHDDAQSDDDHTLESNSDLDSLPRTPATPRRPSINSPKVVRDGPFKVPQDIATPTRRRLNIEEEATIALRTRSKLSLSATSIEHIESSFIPPDDVPTVDVDDPVWNEFLEECLNPTSISNVKNEDDEDADPEYNVAADTDANDEDEALENSIIKISKKELNDLVTELFSIMPEMTPEDEVAANLANNVHTRSDRSKNGPNVGKLETRSDEETPNVQKNATVDNRSSIVFCSVGKSEPEDSANIEEEKREEPKQQNNKNESAILIPGVATTTVYVEEQTGTSRSETPPPQPPPILCVMQPTAPLLLIQLDTTPSVLPEQILILQQQMRQHIQLIASNFLQLFVHPTHWAHAPKYKEYLETLNNLTTSNPNSVVNVCNLKPAVELIATWEKTVSESTPENTAMVEFIQKQIERSRNRSAQNSLYVGEFHDTLKDVVANSPVFLYPYLLPAMPYRADTVRRFKFLRAEDELIALGLDEFWEYVEMNPQLFRSRNKGSVRFGLKATVRLLCRYLMPWCAPHSLLAHLHYVRRTDKDNPIYKFFESRKVEPVKHKLLPFNPKLTLYEQPEYEMPRIWVRHLAKTSKRFRNYLHRRTNVTGMAPRGIDITLGKQVKPAEKKPLPIDFTKVITNKVPCLLPRILPKPPSNERIDIHIQKNIPQTSEQTNNGLKLLTANNKLYVVQQTATVNSVSEPICSPIENNSTQSNLSDPISNASDLKTNENTAESDKANQLGENTQVSDDVKEKENTDMPDVLKSKAITDNDPKQCSGKVSNIHYEERIYDPNHCTCCLLMKKICKERQTLITEYFKPGPYSVTNTCACKGIDRPKITNKLRLLLKYYKSRSMYVHKEMKLKLAQCNENNDDFKYANMPNDDVTELDDISDPNDNEYVQSFQLKLLVRLGLVRNRYIKQKMYVLFSKFDFDTDDPVDLAIALEKYFDVELVDMFKEFLRCLTPEQADKINKFKDYFTQTCASDLVNRISEQVKDKSIRYTLLSRLITAFTDNNSTACEICSGLLKHMGDYQDLAKYTFNLFPHIRDKRQKMKRNFVGTSNTQSSTQNYVSEHEEDPLKICKEPQSAMDYEDDHSSSTNEEKDNDKEHGINSKKMAKVEKKDDAESAEVDQKNVLLEEEQTLPGASPNDLNARLENDIKIELIMSDDDSVKSEAPEWQRSEDKLILEILKKSLTREERKDKTILEILEEKEVVHLITENMSYKSIEDVTERVMYLLELLVLSES